MRWRFVHDTRHTHISSVMMMMMIMVEMMVETLVLCNGKWKLDIASRCGVWSLHCAVGTLYFNASDSRMYDTIVRGGTRNRKRV